jgi:hypothetical protein
MKSLIVTLCSLLLVAGMVFAKAGVGGTVELIDPAGLSVTIMTDGGQPESLPVADVSVLAGVAKGDRVFCEMDDQGKVAKIVKASTIPNTSPAPEPKG